MVIVSVRTACINMPKGIPNQEENFSCPRCGQEIDIPEEGVSGFPQNIDLNHLQKVIRAKISSDASQGGATSGKENPLLEIISCKKHPTQILAMYCERCKEATVHCLNSLC